ncbi:hypothetical protein [Saccharopolyspora gregorii]|uniref:hypothetical protein n=1 Tax=Saccharopolyspora gregorii TaxID=33914 RepID=UPI0021AC3896|nr:hypothetical protein [Saccharopolyspora gregorii]
MSSTQGQLVLVLMGATAAAPWAALALDSRTVRAKLARRKARRTLRAAGFRAVPGRTASITELAMWRGTVRPSSAGGGGAAIGGGTVVREPAIGRSTAVQESAAGGEVAVRWGPAIQRRSAIGRAGAVTPLFSSTVDDSGAGARTAPVLASADEVFVSVGAVVALPDEPPGLAA